ncbi:MAG TPA: RidA family protein [Phycisphaerae bacterium]|nr:RidA family protein [Phycisphaerae bacterium]
MTPSQRLSELRITLPPVTAPIGSYVPGIRTGNLVLVSGQLPFVDGKLTAVGKVGADVPVEQAIAAARQAGLNALGIAAHTAGGIDHIKRIVRLAVFVASAPGFTDQPKVANGASDLMTEIFGEAGKHVRAAVGASELPRGAAVEVELMAEIAP